MNRKQIDPNTFEVIIVPDLFYKKYGISVSELLKTITHSVPYTFVYEDYLDLK